MLLSSRKQRKLATATCLTLSASTWCCHVVSAFSSPPRMSRPFFSRMAVRGRGEESYMDYDDYWDQADLPENPSTADYSSDDVTTGPGVYNVYFEGNAYEKEQVQVDWELAEDGNTWVCLPPAYVSRPTAIVHFCGGTFFGSSPKLWYKTLLEGVVRATQCTIVATPIPVTLLKNPLQHVQLSRTLQRNFQMAVVDILEDEYGDLEDVPIVGMGHSLGARLMTVLATLSQPKNSAVAPYASYILMSFTNYGASASIPGVQSLLKERRKIDYNGGRRRSYDDWEDEDEEDVEWEELYREFQETMSDVKDALTPRSEDLEFVPSPDQLWTALLDDKRYSVPQTLLVQFDQDDVDQSPRLAETLVKTNSSDVKFARLNGNHLTPVNVDDDDNGKGGGGWLQLPTQASKAAWKLIRGSGKSVQQDSESLRDLRQSIARYISDVVVPSAKVIEE